MSDAHLYGVGCVLSDGRFAVFGGDGDNGNTLSSSCEALTLDADGARWSQLVHVRYSMDALLSPAAGTRQPLRPKHKRRGSDAGDSFHAVFQMTASYMGWGACRCDC
jgi:hypothetical protein